MYGHICEPWCTQQPSSSCQCILLRTRLWLSNVSPQWRVCPISSILEPVLCLPIVFILIVLLGTVSDPVLAVAGLGIFCCPATLDSALTGHHVPGSVGSPCEVVRP